ncbi:MAG: hypothetical protein U0M42_08690 [Acutalibacteraceae bacterium]|nr:hypothetical protein [Acutalibacteraceae bacterium]
MFNPINLYVDPSVVTYGIQAIAGVVIAVGAVAAIIWRKAKKKVSDALKLEENSKKEEDAEISLVDDDAI